MRIERLSPEAWTPPYVCPTRARPVPGVRSWEAMRDVDGQGGCPHLDGGADRRARRDWSGVRVGGGRDLR